MAERTAALEASTVRLRDSEASLRAIFDNAGIGISVLNQDTGILQVNQRCRRCLVTLKRSCSP